MEKIKTNLCRLDNIEMDDVINFIFSSTKSNQAKYVVTPNIDHIARLAQQDVRLKQIYHEADLCVNDSRILQKIITSKFGRKVTVVPGSDLTAALLNDPRINDINVLIFGGTDAIFNKFKTRFPLKSLHHLSPSMGFINKPDEVSLLLDEIDEIKPDLIFLAVGSPRQEEFAYLIKNRVKSGLSLCVGASIHFLTGDEKRAPVWMQRMSLEWMHRMFTSGRLFKRYIMNATMLFRLYRAL